MDEFKKKQIIDCYDMTAEKYAREFLDEMEKKPFDSNLLQRFVKMLPENAVVADFGTGCGHIAAYVKSLGISHVLGIDISTQSLELAQKNFPEVEFLAADMTGTNFLDRSLDGMVCFYGIVHFSLSEVEETFREWKRLLVPGGKGLFCFHVGSGELAVENFLETKGAKAVWKYFMPEDILKLLEKTGLEVEETIIRYPYKNIEYESQRCYILFSKV